MITVYQSRQKQILQYIQQTQSEAILLMVPKNIYYFTGFLSEPHERFFALHIDSQTGKSILFVPSLDMDAAQAEAVVDEIIPVSDVENPYEIFKQCIGKVTGRFALEKSYMTISQLEQFNQQIPTFSYEDIETYIWQMRANKSENEIAKIKQAIAISEQALQYTWDQIKIGMTELEVKAELEYQMTIFSTLR